MHPLVTDFSHMRDSELEEKIGILTNRYFQANNPDLKQQIVMVLDSYKEELSKRRRAALERMMSNRDKSLDKLIKVN